MIRLFHLLSKQSTIQMSAVLVVARYTENLDWLNQVPIHKVIYNKGPPLPNSIVVPNIGREAHTYLSFIVDHYDRLPDKVFFTQGDPFPHSPNFFQLLREALEQSFEFISLGIIATEFNTTSRSHPGIEKALHDMTHEIIGHSPSTLFFPAGALFGYSREFIHRHPVEYWQTLLQKCIASYDQPNCNYKDYHRQQPCGCQNPYSPWCFERLWFYL